MQSAVLPIFRSDGQACLLAALLLKPAAGWRSLTQLGRETGLATSTVLREVARLEGAGLVTSRRIGNVREVRANERSRFVPELRGLVTKAFGPAAVLADALGDVDGVREAHIFGSWARHERDPASVEEPPRDIDLLVVGDPDPGDIYRACAAAERAIGLEVTPVILSPAVWAGDESGPAPGFVAEVRGGALIPVLGPETPR